MPRGRPQDDPHAVAVWDVQARHYGKQERFEDRAIDAALRLAAPGAHERLVDLACGTGVLLRELAGRPGHPASAVGIDRSTGMLSRVGPLPAGWHTLEADARSVPLPAGCAEAVTCTYLLHLLGPEDRSAVLREVRRLLAPGAGSRLVVVSLWPDVRAPGGRLVRGVFRELATRRPGRLGGLMPLDPSADLRDAGFTVTHRVQLPRRGYPSVVLRAAPS